VLLLVDVRSGQVTFFGDKIVHLEGVFRKLGCVAVVRSVIRILQSKKVSKDIYIKALKSK